MPFDRRVMSFGRLLFRSRRVEINARPFDLAEESRLVDELDFRCCSSFVKEKIANEQRNLSTGKVNLQLSRSEETIR